jgi:hypothetical protein
MDSHDEPIALEENPPVPVPRRLAATQRPGSRAVAAIKNRLWPATSAVGLLVVLVVIAMVMGSRGSGAKQPGARVSVNKTGIPETLAELDAWYPQMAGAPNAAVFYLKAFNALRLGSGAAATLPLLGHGEMPSPQSPLPTPMKAALAEVLGSYRAALESLAEGAKYDHCRYPIDFTQGIDYVYRPLQNLEKSVFLLVMAGLYHADGHRGDEAAHDVFIAFSLAKSLGEMPCVFAQLLRRRINLCALDALEQVLNRSTPSPRALNELAKLLQKLESSDAQGEFIGRALAGERAMSLAALQQPKQLIAALGAPDLRMSPERRRAITERLRVSEPLVAERMVFESAFRQLVVARNEPFPKRLDADVLGRKLADEADQQGLFVLDLILPSLGRRASLEARCLVLIRLGCVALALERFRAEGGGYPDILSRLVPNYLPELPLDPFRGGPLRYTKTASGFTLTSATMDGEKTFSVHSASEH